MLSPTLTDGLRTYGIGDRIRSLRLRKKMGLVELGRHTGLSPAMLSKLERGRLFPTLPTLLRIALVFGVGLDHFFQTGAARQRVGVVRKAARRRFVERMGGREPVFEFECLDYEATERASNAYWVRFLAAGPRVRRHDHPGSEFVLVESGRLGITIGETEHILDAGDSIYFESDQPHGYRRHGARACEGVVVTVNR
ncbi:MAG: helix-turn-helix domain-containing protein [Vicinamibacterales bacterium]